MSFTNDFFVALAELLAGANIGTYSPSTPYTPNETAITMQILPASPDSAIALTFYPVSDDATLSDSVVGIQVRTRAAGSDAGPVNDLSDAVFDAFQSLPDQVLNGIHIQNLERRSGTLLGKDDEQRWMRSDNYYAQVWRPASHRL